MTTEGTVQDQLSMSGHPDMIELRDRLDRVAETTQARTVEGIAMLAGLYAAVSPWIVNFHGGNPSLTMSDLIVGLAAMLLALDLGSAYSRAHGISWVLPILGVWIIVSLWAIPSTTLDAGVIVSNIVVGAIIVVFGAGAMLMQRMREPRHH